MAEELQNEALTVSQAMALAKGKLESFTVRIVGELSEVSIKPSYKAVYFTIKDAGAALSCMMWNNRYRAAGVDLQVGQLVEITGRFTIYAAKGRMNFDVFSVSLSGEGQLRLQVANLAKKLAAEGLTDPARKRPIPEMPERIGLVTSPNSAAVHDVLRTLRRRFPIAQVVLAGVAVEGVTAASGIAEGIRTVAESGVDVILVVRGGGSFEDMMPFNDEALARTIAACPVPVVTGIGHEVDTSIADMVSDLRASTPTGAAEAVSPSRESLDAWIARTTSSLSIALKRAVELRRAKLDRLAARPMFEDPMRLFSSDALAIDALADRLGRALPTRMALDRQVVSGYRQKLEHRGSVLIDGYRQQVGIAAAQLDALSPVAVLARGYALARTNEGQVVKRVSDAPIGSDMRVTVSDGDINCTVKGHVVPELKLDLEWS